MPPKIDIDKKALSEFCRKHHIRKLWLFGSVLRDDFSDDSDVDVLVEFEGGYIPGFEFITIQNELGKSLLERNVDLILESDLNELISKHPTFTRELIHDER